MKKKHIAIGIFVCDKCDKIKSQAYAVKDQASASEQYSSVDESIFRSLHTSALYWDLIKQTAEGVIENNEWLSHIKPITEYSKN